MVRNAAASLGKVVHPDLQSLHKVCEAVHRYTAYLGKLFQIIKVFRLLQIHGLVRPPGRENLNLKAVVFRDKLMEFQVSTGSSVVQISLTLDWRIRPRTVIVGSFCSLSLHRSHTSWAVRPFK